MGALLCADIVRIADLDLLKGIETDPVNLIDGFPTAVSLPVRLGLAIPTAIKRFFLIVALRKLLENSPKSRELKTRPAVSTSRSVRGERKSPNPSMRGIAR